MNNLIKIREKIDNTDKKIILLLKERSKLSKLIGKLKIKKGLPSLDNNRWQSVLFDKINLAKENNVSEKMITQIYTAIHAESLEIQNKLRKEVKK